MSKHSPETQHSADAEAASAAQRAGLGRAGRAFANTRLGFAWRVKETGSFVYEFEGGLVSQGVGGPAEVFPWGRITQVTRVGTHETKNGKYACTQFVYKVTRDDGAVMEMRGSFISPERSSRADPASTGSRFNKLGEDVNRRVSGAKLPEARAALARGESLTFGYVTISAAGVVLPKNVVAWNLIRDVKMRNGHLDLYQADKKFSLVAAPVSSIPNLPLLLHLIEELRAGAW